MVFVGFFPYKQTKLGKFFARCQQIPVSSVSFLSRVVDLGSSPSYPPSYSSWFGVSQIAESQSFWICPWINYSNSPASAKWNTLLLYFKQLCYLYRSWHAAHFSSYDLGCDFCFSVMDFMGRMAPVTAKNSLSWCAGSWPANIPKCPSPANLWTSLSIAVCWK